MGASFCREVRPVREERGILVVEVDQSSGCHPPTHLFDPFLLPRREDSAARTIQPASPVSSDDHPAFSKQCPKFLEEQAILRYRAEHGGTFQQACAAVIVETPRLVSSRTYAQALRPGHNPKETAQPNYSDKVPSFATPKAKAQRDTPSPRRQGPANLRKKGPLGKKSIVLAPSRTWTLM